MTITIHIPPDAERALRESTADLEGAAKEALLVLLYRQGKLHLKQLSDGLGLDRWQTEEVLKKHNVTEDLPTIEEVREQVKFSRNIRANS
jgi:hypothetical protein